MEESISTESNSAHVLRLALVFLGAVVGLLVLSFVFGSASARADDGAGSSDSLGSAVGSLVSEVTAPVQATVTTVSHAVAATPAVAAATPAVAPVAAAVTQLPSASAITSPAAALADGVIVKVLGNTVLGDALGTTPVGSILEPIATLIDGAAAETVSLVIGTGVQATLAAPVATLQAVPAEASAPVSGFAQGALDLRDSLSGSTGVAGFGSAGGGMLAALAGAGFLVLLAFRRQTLTARAMPGSPVYETDSSPD